MAVFDEKHEFVMQKIEGEIMRRLGPAFGPESQCHESVTDLNSSSWGSTSLSLSRPRDTAEPVPPAAGTNNTTGRFYDISAFQYNNQSNNQSNNNQSNNTQDYRQTSVLREGGWTPKEISNIVHGFARLDCGSLDFFRTMLRAFAHDSMLSPVVLWEPQSLSQILDTKRRLLTNGKNDGKDVVESLERNDPLLVLEAEIEFLSNRLETDYNIVLASQSLRAMVKLASVVDLHVPTSFPGDLVKRLLTKVQLQNNNSDSRIFQSQTTTNFKHNSKKTNWLLNHQNCNLLLLAMRDFKHGHPSQYHALPSDLRNFVEVELHRKFSSKH